MRIVRISAFGLTLPLRRPYELQGGRLRFEKLDSTLVRLDTDEGVSGWGEGCPWGSTYLLGGVTRAPDAPGLGAEPDSEALGDPFAVYR